jgi:uroporphyrinogen-III synthase
MNENERGANVGIPVFLLKTKSVPNDGYEEQFAPRDSSPQFSAHFVPVLEHQLQDDGMSVVRNLLLEQGIGRGETKKYGGMIFTSQRAVEAFAKLVHEGAGRVSCCIFMYLGPLY